MAFVTKTWKDRLVEFAGRRKLKNVSTNEEVLYDVSRSEGTVMQAGDSFNATNMNDLEQRIKTEFDNVNSSLTDSNTSESFNFGSLNGVRGFFTSPSKADDSFIPFNSGFSGANIYMSGTNSGNLPKTENPNIGQYFYGFDWDESTQKFTVLYDGTYSYMLSTTSSYTSLYINDEQIAIANPSSKTLYSTIELKKGDTGYIFSNASGQFAQGYLTRIS